MLDMNISWMKVLCLFNPTIHPQTPECTDFTLFKLLLLTSSVDALIITTEV